MSATHPVSNGITVSSVASLFAISAKTVYAARADGRIQAEKVAGHWSVVAASLFALAAANNGATSGRKSVSLGSRYASQATKRLRGMKYGQF